MKRLLMSCALSTAWLLAGGRGPSSAETPAPPVLTIAVPAPDQAVEVLTPLPVPADPAAGPPAAGPVVQAFVPAGSSESAAGPVPPGAVGDNAILLTGQRPSLTLTTAEPPLAAAQLGLVMPAANGPMYRRSP